jgi:uncharacterized protein (TIGR02246 family)
MSGGAIAAHGRERGFRGRFVDGRDRVTIAFPDAYRRLNGPFAGTVGRGMSDIDAIEAIKQLKARYFRTMDTKDWAAMRDLFTDDVVVDTSSSGGGVVSGADDFIAFLAPTLQDAVTVHHGHMPEITVTSPTTAAGIWSMEDMLRFPDGSELHGYGHYHETYEKSGGAWRIKTLTLTRLRQDLTAPK